MNFAVWQGATRNAGSSRPGAKALMDWVLRNYPNAKNLGIYNYRPVRGSSSLSIHAEGRALDIGFPLVGGRANPDGLELVKRIGARGRELGVQSLIWDRRIWSARSPSGRAYTGVNPHTDHVHLELTREAGESLNSEKIAQLVGGLAARRTLKMSDPRMTGDDVRTLQRAVGIPVDGIFGPKTDIAVRAFQTSQGIFPVDGVVGPRTWAALGV